jgi:hypothetical protein
LTQMGLQGESAEGGNVHNRIGGDLGKTVQWQL